jgi:hypothetical protein
MSLLAQQLAFAETLRTQLEACAPFSASLERALMDVESAGLRAGVEAMTRHFLERPWEPLPPEVLASPGPRAFYALLAAGFASSFTAGELDACARLGACYGEGDALPADRVLPLLGLLLGAGVRITTALEIARDDCAQPEGAALAGAILAAVMAGRSMVGALEGSPGLVSETTRAAIARGERDGSLAAALIGLLPPEGA